MSLTYERSKFISYSYPFNINSVTFATSMPNYSENTQFIYKVFDLEVWLLLLFTMVFLVIFIWVIARNDQALSKAHLCWNFLEIFFRQSINQFGFRIFALNIIFVCWLIFSFEITLFYANTLYTSMILPAQLKTIETIQHLRTALVKNEITLNILKDSSELASIQVTIIWWIKQLKLILFIEVRA